MDRRAFIAAAGAVATAGCTALGSDDYDVGMSAHEFLPEELAIAVGETVVWENTGSRGHTVTAYDGGIPEGAAFFATGGYGSEAEARDAWEEGGGGLISTGERFEHTFEVPGRHAYVCIPHEVGGMIGAILVEE
ncbi:cupredoxin domain-containing protein [Natronorarus salvus]|uniref:cupredoxin domain-containing protein n=1 Tax=Natronorarus salvus TaxID=3117733 RepID=UPI002F26B658